jgi:type II secretory pathway pseudopilin PulG
MAGRRINRSRAGIEAAVLAVLMVIIALALAGIVWLFASTQTQTLAKSAKIDIIDAKAMLTTSGTTGTTSSLTAMVVVKNTGSVEVRSITVKVAGQDCGSISSIPPGGTGAVACSISAGSLKLGDKISITVSGTAVTGEQVAAAGQAVVM